MKYTIPLAHIFLFERRRALPNVHGHKRSRERPFKFNFSQERSFLFNSIQERSFT